ncbi:pilus assembly PilX family protein [Moritella sp. 36]|uniref:pilus assembly PilX family protein n=1 Tax=Moritella sp. 36 TaxID=2746233 RepID=UPI0021075EE1|nr:PilX N-terminal domain-containing pilus assembly protein [Moritella sp. 36]
MQISIKQQQGSMLVIALFIIVVMSLLAATLSRVLSSTADSVANEVYSAKAYYGAESGMDYGIYQVLERKQACANFPNAPTDLQFDISNEVGLENCSVTITCQSIPVNNSSLFYLTSTGNCDGGKIIAEHKIEAEVKI